MTQRGGGGLGKGFTPNEPPNKGGGKKKRRSGQVGSSLNIPKPPGGVASRNAPRRHQSR